MLEGMCDDSSYGAVARGYIPLRVRLSGKSADASVIDTCGVAVTLARRTMQSRGGLCGMLGTELVLCGGVNRRVRCRRSKAFRGALQKKSRSAADRPMSMDTLTG